MEADYSDVTNRDTLRSSPLAPPKTCLRLDRVRRVFVTSYGLGLREASWNGRASAGGGVPTSCKCRRMRVRPLAGIPGARSVPPMDQGAPGRPAAVGGGDNAGLWAVAEVAVLGFAQWQWHQAPRMITTDNHKFVVSASIRNRERPGAQN